MCMLPRQAASWIEARGHGGQAPLAAMPPPKTMGSEAPGSLALGVVTGAGQAVLSAMPKLARARLAKAGGAGAEAVAAAHDGVAGGAGGSGSGGGVRGSGQLLSETELLAELAQLEQDVHHAKLKVTALEDKLDGLPLSRFRERWRLREATAAARRELVELKVGVRGTWRGVGMGQWGDEVAVERRTHAPREPA